MHGATKSVVAIAAVATGLLLAGCGAVPPVQTVTIGGEPTGSGGASPTDTPTDTATATPTPTDSPSTTYTKPDDPTPDASTPSPSDAPTSSVAPVVPAPLGPTVLRVANLLPRRQHWPVAASLRDWNANGRVQLVPVSSCGYLALEHPTDAGCVDIVLEHHGDEHPGHTDTIGANRWQIVMNAAVVHGQSRGLHQWRQALVCHELGHVLLGQLGDGVDHLERGHGCLDVDVLEWRDHPGSILLDAVRSGILPPDLGA